MYIDDIKCNMDFFEIVDEPDYSFEILKAYQQKYCISTYDLYIYYKLIPDIQVNFDADILKNWMFNYSVYLKAGGDPDKLLIDFNSNHLGEFNQQTGQDISNKKGSDDASLLS